MSRHMSFIYWGKAFQSSRLTSAGTPEPDATAYTKGLYEALTQESLAIIEETGMEFFTLSPEEEAKYLAAGALAWQKLVEDTEQRPGGENIREYIKDCIAYRNKVTGEPWTVYDPFK